MGTKEFIKRLIKGGNYQQAWTEIEASSELDGDWLDERIIEIVAVTTEGYTPRWTADLIMRIADKRKNRKFIIDNLIIVLDSFIEDNQIDRAKVVAEFINKHEEDLYYNDNDPPPVNKDE
ncbi:hypothetical protein ACFL3M_03290 [Patescibacteria group bacterium]